MLVTEAVVRSLFPFASLRRLTPPSAPLFSVPSGRTRVFGVDTRFLRGPH